MSIIEQRKYWCIASQDTNSTQDIQYIQDIHKIYNKQNTSLIALITDIRFILLILRDILFSKSIRIGLVEKEVETRHDT